MIQSSTAGHPALAPASGNRPAASPERSARNLGIDALRYGLAFLVVLLHALPGYPEPGWAVAIQFACRAAVPFFFVTSGYFLPRAPGPALDFVRKTVMRIVPVYALWMAIYFLYFTLNPVSTLIARPQDLISGGGAFHLWFLPALGFGLVSVGLGMRIAGPWVTGLACLALAALGIATSSYAPFIDPAMEPRRGGLLIAPVLIFAGHMAALHGLRMKPLHAAALFAVANLLVAAEEHFIRAASQASQLVSHDFVASTIPLGMSLFLVAQSLPAGRLITACASFGKLSLGIYASHLMILLTLSRFTDRATAPEAFALALATFLAATVLVLAMRRSRRLAGFVG